MPIDHDYRMSIEAKPLYSQVAKSDNGGLVKIVRPLGSIRKAKFTNVNTKSLGLSSSSSNTTNITDSIERSELVTLTDDQISQHADTSSVVKDSSANETDMPQLKESLPPMDKTKRKIFESRYKIAASRNSTESVKPAKLYDKRVIYLPMFRINVETYVANSEDNKAVENTRQSLKKMIDMGRQRAKSSGRRTAASVKSYNFMSPGKDGEQNYLATSSPRRLLQTEKQLVYTPRKKKSEASGSDINSTNISSNTSEDKDRMDIKIESLELSSLDGSEVTVTELENCSVASSVGNRSLGSRLDKMKVNTRTNNGNGFLTLSDPYRTTRSRQSQPRKQDSQTANWPSYEDFRKMRQKIRWQKNAQRQMERAVISGQSSNEVQKWVNIHYKKSTPVMKYTSQPSPTKLTPIIVPSHTCVECPMCSMASRYDKKPTSCPPNSPTLEDTENVTPNSTHSRCHSGRKDAHNESLVTSRSSQNSKTEVLTIPKVTVKVLGTKEQLEEAKMGYTRTMT